MSTFFEIDFLEVGESKSGDAIALRYDDYNTNKTYIHIVDGGYSTDGEKLVHHIRDYYDNPTFIDHVILTHPDGDHAAGLKTVLEQFDVGCLWMNRPWLHVLDLLERFDYAYTEQGLIRRLKKDFPHTAALEDFAERYDVPIRSAFQGAQIGKFLVLGPSYDNYLDLIVEDERTPIEAKSSGLFGKLESMVKYVRSVWGDESLKGDTEGTSPRNEASIVQFANICGDRILLTGDAGIRTLDDAHTYALSAGIDLPGIDRFQVPHHGSRRNLSSSILDKWVGTKYNSKPEAQDFTAIVSANENDSEHPRKAVVRALMHRAGEVITTKGMTIQISKNAPQRPDWFPVQPLSYPDEMEE